MAYPFLSFYHQAYSAVTDFSFYRAVFEQSLHKTLIYLFYLATHVAAILTLTFALHYGPQFLSIADWAQQNFPPFEVEDGKLRVATDQPLVKKYPGKQLITFVFDTTGTYSDPQELEDPAFLFTEEKLYFRYLGQTQTYSWKDWGPFQVGPKEFEHFTTLVKWAYFPIAYSLILVYTVVVKGLLAALLTIVGLSASVRYDIRLPFQQHFTIALYSLTPAIVIDLAVTMTGLDISYFYLIYLVTAAIYTYMATQKCVAVE